MKSFCDYFFCKRFFLIYLLIFPLFGCFRQAPSIVKPTVPKNVVLLICDGAGLSQISSAYFYKNKSVNYSRFKNIGLIHVNSSDHLITDSAASGTAFATGHKTYNTSIGVSDEKVELANLVEIASNSGVNCGIVTTSSITHATPASFFAHVSSRYQEEEIAMQLADSEVDFFAGGGVNFFNNRSDNLNIIDRLISNGFSVNTNALDELKTIKKNDKQAYILAPDGMPKVTHGRGNFLEKATILGINFLQKNDNPFFIMSEGAQVDWAGHDNDSDYLVSEMIDFDNTIGSVLDFAELDGETLVIVTADHETGGFTLSGKKGVDSQGKIYEDYNEIEPSFSTNGHSATLIPIFAFGPGSQEFNGIYHNNEVFHKILKLTNWHSAN